MNHQSSICKAVFIFLWMLLVAPGWSSARGLPQIAVEQPETIRCPSCHAPNQWDYKFCIHCGEALSEVKTDTLRTMALQERLDLEALADSLEKSAGITGTPSARTDITVRVSGEEGRARPVPPRSSIQTHAPSVYPEKWYKRVLNQQANLPRLFNIPTAFMLNSLDIYFSGGGAFGIEKDRNFLAKASLGLGNIAEVEVATQSVINSLRQASNVLPTSAFKMRLLPESNRIPGVAAALRSTTGWNTLKGRNPGVSFETRLTKLYIVASKEFGSVSAHAGMGLTDVRVRNPQGWTYDAGGKDELQVNLWSPFGGFVIRANPKTLVMFEIEGIPSYNFEEGGNYSSGDIETVWTGVTGVRFYFANWLAADTGVRYRSDFDGIADATIQASFNVLLPVGSRSNR